MFATGPVEAARGEQLHDAEPLRADRGDQKPTAATYRADLREAFTTADFDLVTRHLFCKTMANPYGPREPSSRPDFAAIRLVQLV